VPSATRSWSSPRSRPSALKEEDQPTRNTIPNDEFDYRRNGVRRSTRIYSNEAARKFTKADIAIHGRDALRDLIGGNLDIATNPGGFYLADAYFARNNPQGYADIGGLNPSAFISGERLLLRRDLALRSGSGAIGLLDAAMAGDIGIGDFILGGAAAAGVGAGETAALAYNEVRSLGGIARAAGTRAAANLNPEQRVDELLGAAPPQSSGWRVGESIEKATRAGNSPAWSTVRPRYWKNVANGALESEFSVENVARMFRPRPPLHDELGVAKELNHILPRHLGGGHARQ
jgi:hypothetical protein